MAKHKTNDISNPVGARDRGKGTLQRTRGYLNPCWLCIEAGPRSRKETSFRRLSLFKVTVVFHLDLFPFEERSPPVAPNDSALQTDLVNPILGTAVFRDVV